MINFEKYHGLGNDFVIVSESELARAGFESSAFTADSHGTEDGEGAIFRLTKLARSICDRRLGVGADGMVIVRTEPLTMDIMNSDGSIAPMCGNAIRCVADYCVRHDLIPAAAGCKDGIPAFNINTLAGVMTVRLISKTPDLDGDGNGETARARARARVQAQWAEHGSTVEVNMGHPDFTPALSRIDTDKENFLRVNHKVDFCGSEKNIILSTFFMGTIHTVVWLEENDMTDYSAGEKEAFGKTLSEDPVFMDKTNVNMARIIDEDNVELITFERGAGLTSACGTGACATAVLGNIEGKLSKNVKIRLPLGTLQIRIADDGSVFMTGPAVHVFSGRTDIKGNIV